MEQVSIESAQHYYNDSRKKSFFYSRIFVFVSMFVLLVGLGINVALLNSQQRTSTTSQASSNNQEQTLPALPSGCEYQKTDGQVKVSCITQIPEVTKPVNAMNTFPISIDLPQLPAQCKYQTTNKGLSLACTSTQTPIQTTVVTLPTGCVPANSGIDSAASCTQAGGKKVLVSLPKLPEGCIYNKGESAFTITCSALKTL